MVIILEEVFWLDLDHIAPTLYRRVRFHKI